MQMIIVKSDGTSTLPMHQTQIERYLGNMIESNRTASLKQALNQAFDGNGKATSTYQHQGRAILHASSGDGAQSVSIFYYVNGGLLHLVAMGEHVPVPKSQPPKYRLSDYGQASGSMRDGDTISL